MLGKYAKKFIDGMYNQKHSEGSGFQDNDWPLREALKVAHSLSSICHSCYLMHKNYSYMGTLRSIHIELLDYKFCAGRIHKHRTLWMANS